ncbi:MAG TPA: EpsI family protein [Phenylobacterium sp.]|nr:exosortase-associated protein EpsI, V-type [Phenylobacterium sp.]HLZ75496.1 EpsI family protein [Phenylobacterium sp.]
MGGAGAAAAALAYQLKPHHKLNLLGHRKMADIVPVSFGVWSSQGENSLVTPATEGKLAARLYNEIVSRIYTQAETGEQIMMLIAYGDTQSDLLQLHRPEACYPAVGFHLASAQTAAIPLSPHAVIPGRRVLAELEDRHERIVYWTRVGEFLPATSNDQRKAQLKTAMQGFVPDGALFRFSSLRPDPSAFDVLDGFIAGLVLAVAPTNRPPLVGSALASEVGV